MDRVDPAGHRRPPAPAALSDVRTPAGGSRARPAGRRPDPGASARAGRRRAARCGVHRLADAGHLPGRDHLDPWSRLHLDQLADLEATWADHAAGDTLLHADLRADNLL